VARRTDQRVGTIRTGLRVVERSDRLAGRRRV
jgi:hypothetical protein